MEFFFPFQLQIRQKTGVWAMNVTDPKRNYVHINCEYNYNRPQKRSTENNYDVNCHAVRDETLLVK